MRTIRKQTHCVVKLVVALACVAGPGVSYPEATRGSAQLAKRGEDLSKLLCTACHVVADDQEFAPILTQPTPSFSEIANRPDTTAKSLQQFISATHWDEQTIPMQMPSQRLSKEEMKAVTTYILSLRRP